MKNRNTIFRATLLIVVCFALLPGMQAVSPPPDGGYPGGNTAEGQSALLSLTSGAYNTAVGFLSLASDTTNNFNTAIGAGALFVNTADENTATGAGALLTNTTGLVNTANGAFALSFNTTGTGNSAIGADALSNNTTGSGNTAAGTGALFVNTIGSGNIALGIDAGDNVTTANNVICIGLAGPNVSNTAWIGNIYNTTTVSGTTLPVIVSDEGQLGTISSSRRFKKEVKPMDQTSEAVLALKPVTFHYKSDAKNTPCFGLIAEEVAEVNPDLVIYDKEGKPYTVRYEAVNAMLLNEFLKHHKVVERQQVTIAKLRSAVARQRKDFETVAAKQQEQIQALTAGLQKVTVQLASASPSPGRLKVSESGKGRIQHSSPATRVALNNP